LKAYFGYAVTGAGVVALLAGLLGWALGPHAVRSVWWGAGLAYAVQLVAFAALLRFRRGGNAFLAVWGGGVLARLIVVLAGAFWVTRSTTLEPAPALLSLAGFLFVLLLMEPVFFIVGRREG